MIKIKAPAKINLFLRILGKRPDGYHELASLFQAIDLNDELTLELHSKDHFSSFSLPMDDKNLAIKALHLFRQAYAKPFFIRAHLDKKIPIEAGLGGGSSDAAAMLKGLNQLLSYPLGPTDLHQIATKIGSDVPFFLSSGTAYCTGRGEIAKSLPALPSTTFWIVKPPQGLSTPQVYKALNLKALPIRDPQLALSHHLAGRGEYFNDLEDAALSCDPSLSALKTDLLSQGFKTVCLSGSGSSFFCIGPQTPHAPSSLIFKCNSTSLS